MYKQCIATYPAKSGAHSPVAVADRGSIDEGTTFEVGIGLFDFAYKLIHHPLHPLVIIFTVCILGYPYIRFYLAIRLISKHQRDYASRPLDQQARVTTHIDIAFHIVHIGLIAATEPFTKGILILANGIYLGNAAVGETDLNGEFFDCIIVDRF